MITIVIPLYNKESQIVDAIQSVFSQSFQDFELIVVNDGSTDNSIEMVKRFVDPRIKLITQKNAGVSAARNHGIKEAKGEFITFLDADDSWEPDFLKTQIYLAKKYTDCHVFVTNYMFRYSFGEQEYTIIKKLPFTENDGVLSNYFEIASCSHPPITSISVMMYTKAILSIGGFPVGIKSGEDLLTWARLAVRYKIAYSRSVMAIYNMGEGYNFSNLPPRKQDMNDPVGKALVLLHHQYPAIKGLRQYVSHWHKMRASVSIRYGEKKETILEIFKALFYNPFNYKVIPFIILVMIPSKFRMRIISLKK